MPQGIIRAPTLLDLPLSFFIKSVASDNHVFRGIWKWGLRLLCSKSGQQGIVVGLHMSQ
jgi:hypothetical protein